MLNYQNGQFYMDEAPFQIHSGAIHYFRTLPQQWEDRLHKMKDCFIHLDNFTKGFVTVNGFNLGRFWNKGPQMSLYLPWPILKEENEVIVYAEDCSKPEIVISDEHILAGGKNFSYPVTVL